MAGQAGDGCSPAAVARCGAIHLTTLLLLAALLTAVSIGCGESSAADGQGEGTTAPAAADGKGPVLLMFHSGGFLLGSPESLERAGGIAERLGFESVAVPYKLQDLSGAAVQSKRIARRYRRQGRDVYAYGESAGGLFASLLAERNLAGAAAVYSSISDLPDFIRHTPNRAFFIALLHATRKQIRKLSPINAGPSASPVLAMTPLEDSGYLNRATHRWARQDPRVHVRDVPGGHVGGGDADVYETEAERALRWLARRAGLDSANAR